MPKLVFDIETVGENFEDLDEKTQQALTNWVDRSARNDEEKQAHFKDIRENLGLSPLTGEIISIAVLDVKQDKGVVYYQAPGEKNNEFTQDNFTYKQMTEMEMLKNFWAGAQQYDEFISFNGRSFDAPFLAVRSAVHGIKPSKDLMSNRYLNSQKFNAKHIDLFDQLSFYGAVWKNKGNLHLWTRAFGIKSPKDGDITGSEVPQYFANKKYQVIAEYNAADVVATKELYLKWEEFIKF